MSAGDTISGGDKTVLTGTFLRRNGTRQHCQSTVEQARASHAGDGSPHDEHGGRVRGTADDGPQLEDEEECEVCPLEWAVRTGARSNDLGV